MDLGVDRICRLTATVFGPGFLPVLVGRHLTLAIRITSFHEADYPVR